MAPPHVSEEVMASGQLNDQQLLRYSRHMMLPQIDAAGQSRLCQARVLIIGLGGLGSSASMYLAASGVGEMVVADGDVVELSNLQRQLLHGTDDLGTAKTESAKKRLAAINPEVKIRAINCKLEGEMLQQEVAAADLVLDATDNFSSRFAINLACANSAKVMVSAAAIRFEGQISVFDHSDANCPCYRCLYSDEYPDSRDTCEQSGVVSPLLGVLGSLQALEAIKVVTGAGKSLAGRLLLLDALAMEWQSIKLPQDPNCVVCAQRQG